MIEPSVHEATPTSRELRSWLPVAAVLLGTGWGANQFSPMLLVYHRTLGLGTGTLEALFGVYAAGLIPGLLVAGPLSDAHGRRPVVVPAAALSLLATLVLIAGSADEPLLFLGRLMAGVSSGAVFGSGTAWLREISRPPFGTASDHTAAQRAAIAMTVGFGLGPLIAGLSAQWIGDPEVVPYLPHVVLMLIVLYLVRDAPETVTPDADRRLALAIPGARSERFVRVVAPMAPWVFAAPAIAFALLPSVVGAAHASDGIALTAGVTGLCAGAGVLIQPLGRRIDARRGTNLAGTAGLLVLTVGLVLAAITAQLRQTWLLVPSGVTLGCAYGLCLVAGLVEIQRLADQHGLARLTAAYYALTYLGFAAPFLLALAARIDGYAILLVLAAALSLITAVAVTAQAGWRPARMLVPTPRR